MPLLALVLVFCGCQEAAKDAAPPSQPAPKAQRDTLKIAVPAEPRDLLGVISQSSSDSAVIEATSAVLMEPDFDCRITWQPSLAQSWVFSTDGRGVTLTLREDRAWEDGVPVTAADVAFTYALLADPKVASPRAEVLTRLDPEARPRVIDAHTVEFRFTESYDRAAMLADLAVPLAPAHVLDMPTVDRSKLREHPIDGAAPVSGGPFRLSDWKRGERLTLIPNPQYGGKKAELSKLEKVELDVIPAYADRLAALAAGQVDLVDGVLVEDADRLAEDHPEIAFHRRGWRTLDYVAWNSLDSADYAAKAASAGGKPDLATVAPHRLFGDRELRRALTAAIDVDGMIKALLTSEASGEVYGRPAVGTITPALCSAHADAIVRIPFDPAAARTQLEALGWTDSNGDGWLDHEGTILRFELLTSDGVPRRTLAATRIQDALKAVGIDMKVTPLAQEALLERLHNRDFDAALTSLGASLYVNPTPMWSATGDYNFVGFRSEAADALLARGLAESDADAARAIWREYQQVVYDEQPATFLYWVDDLVALHNRFRSPVIDVIAPYRRLQDWSVPIDRVKYRE